MVVETKQLCSPQNFYHGDAILKKYTNAVTRARLLPAIVIPIIVRIVVSSGVSSSARRE